MRWWWRLVRFGFRLLYNEFAWTYDAVAWLVSAGEWREWQRTAIRAINRSSDSTVLEVAHGTGNLHRDMLDAEYRCIGADISPAMGRIASGKLRRAGHKPNLVRASAFALPFADGTFDAVICTFPTDFLIAPQASTEFRRVLRPDGSFAIVLHGVLLRGWWRPLLDVLFRITGQGQIQQDRIPDEDELTGHYLRLIAVFEAVGLTCEVKPFITPRGYAVVACGRAMPQ